MNAYGVRIISGKWRRRRLSIVGLAHLRPTPDRVRETLFNWIGADIINKTVLDLFAGSGILSFEALSRGAKLATLVEINALACKQLRESKAQLSQTMPATIVHEDAHRYLKKKSPYYFDYVFLDPPFKFNLIHTTLKLLGNMGFMRVGTKVYIEHFEPIITEELPVCVCLVKKSRAGRVFYTLLSVETL